MVRARGDMPEQRANGITMVRRKRGCSIHVLYEAAESISGGNGKGGGVLRGGTDSFGGAGVLEQSGSDPHRRPGNRAVLWRGCGNNPGYHSGIEIMLNDFNCACPVYIACGYTDLRRGIDGLAGIAQAQFRMDPFQQALFLLCGRRRDRLKALYWEGDGSLLLYKRLESGSFQWPWSGDEVWAMTPQQYRWLMEGLGIEQPKAHKAVSGLSMI